MIPPLTSLTTLHVVAVLFVATLIRSAFGFGEALVAVPLLALVLPVEVAAPVAVLVSVTVAGIVVVEDWRHVHLRSAGWLAGSALPGIPLGLVLLKTAPEFLVKAILGVVILGFSLYSMLSRGQGELKHDRFAWIFGFSSGVLGGAYGMNGPPLVIYGLSRRWSPTQFRATLQGYFLIASLVGMAGYWIAGLWTRTVTGYYLASLPFVFAAVWLGKLANRRLGGRRFLQLVYVMLALIGAILLTQAWRTAFVLSPR